MTQYKLLVDIRINWHSAEKAKIKSRLIVSYISLDASN